MHEGQLYIYNTKIGKKEFFQPISPPLVGIYLCGPTVYSHSHLGHARSAITFDIIIRYLKFLNYDVKYIRNITDVGHLERDSDEGDDKMLKKAKLENLHVMELAHKYTNSYHHDLEKLNVLTPNIEPRATGHILEQIEFIECILKNNFAYAVNGSVYFDVKKFSKKYNYGSLSGKKIEDLLSGTRTLSKQQEKKFPLDFALWKNATDKHIMNWNSPWGKGFPGWHIECSAMSKKYLGDFFDIHGGGLELSFPHHECEIAQSLACFNHEPAKYWIHHNMVTINNQKMSKSLNNFITLNQLFTGDHNLLDKSYSPMVLRFFILQAHYRSTLSFSLEALKSAEKGYKKLINTLIGIKKIKYEEGSPANHSYEIADKLKKFQTDCYNAMNDDFNTAIVISSLFHISKILNAFISKEMPLNILSKENFYDIKKFFITFVESILGLKDEQSFEFENILEIVTEIYKISKDKKEYSLVDMIREKLVSQGVSLEDKKDGSVGLRFI